MILLSPLCSNALQLTGATSAHGTWTASEGFCLQAQPASRLPVRTRHSYTHLFLHPGFCGRKAQVHRRDESCSIIQQVLISAPREPPPPRCYIMSHPKECGKVHYSCFCTCQCQPKIETMKYHCSNLLFAVQILKQRLCSGKYVQEFFYVFVLKRLKSKNSHPLSTKLQSTSEGYKLLVVAFVGNTV